VADALAEHGHVAYMAAGIIIENVEWLEWIGIKIPESEDDMKSSPDKHNHILFVQSFRGVRYWDFHPHRTHLPDDTQHIHKPANACDASSASQACFLRPASLDMLMCRCEVEIYLLPSLLRPRSGDWEAGWIV
jgi:hypothetical protein